MFLKDELEPGTYSGTEVSFVGSLTCWVSSGHTGERPQSCALLSAKLPQICVCLAKPNPFIRASLNSPPKIWLHSWDVSPLGNMSLPQLPPFQDSQVASHVSLWRCNLVKHRDISGIILNVFSVSTSVGAGGGRNLRVHCNAWNGKRNGIKHLIPVHALQWVRSPISPWWGFSHTINHWNTKKMKAAPSW